jgi:hypothetical protein
MNQLLFFEVLKNRMRWNRLLIVVLSQPIDRIFIERKDLLSRVLRVDSFLQTHLEARLILRLFNQNMPSTLQAQIKSLG